MNLDYVADGGQVVRQLHGQPDTDEMTLLLQVLDIDGPAALVSTLPVRNASNRVIGTCYFLTEETAAAIRESMAAYRMAEGDAEE